MRITPLLLLLTLIIIPNLAGVAGAAGELALKQQQYNEKLDQLGQLSTQLTTADTDYQKALAQYEAANKTTQIKQDVYNKAKDDYERASKDIDLISPDKLAELARTYQAANNELKVAQEEQKKAENEKVYLEKTFINLRSRKVQQEKELLAIKADIFDLDLRQPVWVEGSGESIQDGNKTPNECKKLALDAALQDALEKGGKAVIESVTKVEMFQVTKDEIKLTAKVQVLEQDTSGDYGTIKQVIVGDIIKYQAKVRIKVQSVDTYNPYREQLKGQTTVADTALSNEATGTTHTPGQSGATVNNGDDKNGTLRFEYEFRAGAYVRILHGTVRNSKGLWRALLPLQPPPGARGGYGLIGDDRLLGKAPGFGLRQLGSIARRYITFDSVYVEQPSGFSNIGVQEGVFTSADALNDTTLGWVFFDLRPKFEADLKQRLNLAP
jgi:hypothetical protein